MTDSNKNAYRQVFKATSIFGGVQVFNILIGLVRSKIVAVLLGPYGFGFMGLLNSPLSFIGNLTGLGIDFSAVRDISVAHEANDQAKLSATLKIFRRWVWFTGLLGMTVVIILSPWLSRWSFGGREYTWAFLFLSITLLINSISSGQSAVLRGTRRIKDTAKAGVLGSALGLVVSIPFYYFYGIRGIIPAIIITALTMLFLSWYFSKKVKVIPVQITYRESYTQGKAMVKLGIMISLSALIGSAVTYFIVVFIRSQGGMADVGLYTAGWAITNQYTGLVFAAMAADYYPRLAGVHTDNLKIKEIVNQQIEIAILIIGPIMLFYLTSLPILVQLLFTEEFLAIIPFTQWMVIGMLFRTVVWGIGFVILAKGGRQYLLVEGIVGNVIQVVSLAGGYYLFGLEGIGIGFLLMFVLSLALVFSICKKKYNFSFSSSFLKIFVVQLLFCLAAFLIVYFFDYPVGYISGGLLLVFSALFSYKELNKRIDIKEIIKTRISKK